MPRLIIILALVALSAYAIYKIWQARGSSGSKRKLFKPKNSCPKCDGQGYWEGLRGREKCDQCNGTGRLPY